KLLVMVAFSTAELLNTWERGLSHSPSERAFDLLTLANAGPPREHLELLSIGQPDTRLLGLGSQLFGSNWACLTNCPSFGAVLELGFDAADISVIESERTETLTAVHEGCQLRFRLPNSVDLVDVMADSAVAEARLKLFERCLFDARRDGELVPAHEVSAEAI